MNISWFLIIPAPGMGGSVSWAMSCRKASSQGDSAGKERLALSDQVQGNNSAQFQVGRGIEPLSMPEHGIHFHRTPVGSLGCGKRRDLIMTEGTMGVGGGRGEAIWTEGMGAISEESASDLMSSSIVGTSTSQEVDGPVGQGESGSIMANCFGNMEWGRWAWVDGVSSLS